MTKPMTIAHLSDLHLGPIAGFSPRYWNMKRASGYYNWSRHRRWVHQRDVVEKIVVDITAQQPDHIAVTGDLVNIGLPQEHIEALAWLYALGEADHVTVVPGNHDVYSGIGRDLGTRRWAAYMQSNAQGAPYVRTAGHFPFVRVLGRVALIGLNSAVPTPPFMAWGRLGKDQLAALADCLEALAGAGLFRLVLIHHPPLPGQCSRSRGLVDAEALEGVLARYGAELIIHGHNHVNMLVWGSGPSHTFPVIGTPSASLARRHGDEPLGRYNLYHIDPATRGIEFVGRGLVEPDGEVVEVERRRLIPPA